MALSLVNQKNVSSLDEKSIPAEKAKLFYKPVLLKLIESHDWSFCTKVSIRTGEEAHFDEEIDIPRWDNGYLYRYSLPENAIKFGRDVMKVTLFGSAPSIERPRNQYSKPPYLYEFGSLFSDEPELFLSIIYFHDELSYYSSSFSWALTYALAAALTKVLIDSASYSQLMEAKSKECLLDAISEDQGRQSIKFATH
jgi:hypothetical protein